MNDRDWAATVRELRSCDGVEVAVSAAKRLHRTATEDDVPRLRELLTDDSFFVRESAAWPLSELAGAVALPELLRAYQRGFDEGHDNDGFTTALIDLAAADPKGVRTVLQRIADSGDQGLRDNAIWLMEFCEQEGDA